MNFDLIKNIVSELREQLSGAKVTKIYQPSPEILIFKLWNGRTTLRLLISAQGQKSRIHLTEQSWPNPHIPPRFCQLLRARMSRINAISVVNNDRIVQFECTGKQGNCRLLVELTGNYSNMLLVDDRGVIIDVLKRTSGEKNKRTLLAGERYLFPDPAPLLSKGLEQVVCEEDCSWNQTVERLYTQSGAAEHKKDFKQQLLHTIQRNIKKLRNRLQRIEKELLQQQDADFYRQRGDLLLSNLHLIKAGDSHVSLLNFFIQPPENIEIPLDSALTPQQNAEKYFKKYKKYQRGKVHSQRRMAETQAELEWLEQLDYQLKDCVKNSDIEEIAVELRQAKLLKEENNLHKKKTLQPSQPHESLSPSGFKVIWGRNNRQNDQISTRIARSTDLWFHASHIPGAHVLLQIPKGQQPDEADTLYAASIAAGYSRAREDDKVEVMVASAKSIHKPRGSKGGLVNVLNYKTVMVKPHRPD